MPPVCQPNPLFSSNSEETGTRIWLHARRTEFTQVLVLSPDTDVYFIGLPLQCNEDKDSIVQISKMNSNDIKLLHLKELIMALKNDGNLSSIESTTIPHILQVLYVVTTHPFFPE